MEQKKNNKIGLALITCDRLDFFNKSVKSAIDSLKNFQDSEFVVINDGNDPIESSEYRIINTEGKIGVGKAKNLALKDLTERGCSHIFLMEDDVEIVDCGVFDAYIKTSELTGIKHFNFGLHGNHNLDPQGKPIVRKTVNYPNDIKIDLYPNLLGAFSYYNSDVLKIVGFMDEKFYNALEHVDHTYQIIRAGYHPPFRWFADIENSGKYIKDIVPDHQQSKIRNEDDFMENFQKGLDVFIRKNGFSIVQGYGPNEAYIQEPECLESLKKIYKKANE